VSDLLLDTTTHDLTVESFDLSLVSGIDNLVQKLKIRLLFFFGEWFLDTALGVPYYDTVLVKNPNVPQIDALLKSVILATEGVTEIISYTSDYDNGLRKLSVSFEAKTIYGENLTFEETIP
jgi:hypothetical protein